MNQSCWLQSFSYTETLFVNRAKCLARMEEVESLAHAHTLNALRQTVDNGFNMNVPHVSEFSVAHNFARMSVCGKDTITTQFHANSCRMRWIDVHICLWLCACVWWRIRQFRQSPLTAIRILFLGSRYIVFCSHRMSRPISRSLVVSFTCFFVTRSWMQRQTDQIEFAKPTNPFVRHAWHSNEIYF